jgi:DNA replication and repair protein RecF
MKEISDGEEKIELIYKSEVEYSSDIKKLKENYLEFFEKIKENEFNAGISLAGPHRDDIEIEINGKNSRSFASQGQQRSVVLSIKLAEGEVIKDNIGEYPVYIFDDVLSELDEKRQRYVLEKNEEKQIIITCCNESEILSRVKNKKIVKRGEYF